MNEPLLFSNDQILAARPPKNDIDERRPYAYLVEPECSASGEVVDVATLFLSNRECPFRCLMCDLWKNTTDHTIARGAIVEQIDFALERLPPARQIKLYNSGNFFDRRAILPEDHAAIANRVRGFERVIVENHPKFVGASCVEFRDRLEGDLEVAIGLETVHPEILPRLNKSMTLDDFDRAVEYLLSRDIAVRAFVLLRTPFMSESEGVEWALKSVDHALGRGVQCCSIIPTRAGNGILDQLQVEGQFEPPRLRSMEQVFDESLRCFAGQDRNARRVFIDLWDAQKFADCQRCSAARIERMQRQNLTQTLQPAYACSCEQPYD